MSFTPEQKQMIAERARRDAERDVAEGIRRIKAAGLEPTDTLIRAYLVDHALPKSLKAAIEEDRKSGMFDNSTDQ